MIRILKYTVPQKYCGTRLNDALRRSMKMSGSLIKELKTYEDGVMLNGSRARTTDTVKSGDTIACTLHDRAPDNIIPTAMQLDILYEDEDILIINKPPHMTGSTERRTRSCLRVTLCTRGICGLPIP